MDKEWTRGWTLVHRNNKHDNFVFYSENGVFAVLTLYLNGGKLVIKLSRNQFNLKF